MIKVAITVALVTLSSSALANKRTTDLQPHIPEQLNKTTITLPTAVSDDTSGLTRSQLKVQEDIAGRFRSLYTTEMDKTKAQIALEREAFILNNVPVQYIIAGERAVQQYIQDHFIQPASSKKVEQVVSWSSTNNALTIVEKEPVFQPVIQVTKPIEVEEEKKPNQDELSRIAESLGALGISINEAGKIAEPPSEPQVNTEPIRTNVILNKVNVKRMVMLGKQQQLDATLHLSVLSGANKRDISFNVEKIAPGTIFTVEGINFEFSSMSPNELLFVNTETGIEFKERVK